MESTTKTTLESKVADYKLIARQTLRMELISPRLTKIAELESEKKGYEDEVNNYNHRVVVEKYEKSVADKDQPDFKENQEQSDDSLAWLAKEIELANTGVTETQKAIDEQKKSLTAIETGETKVCLDRLNQLVDQMIEQDALASVTPTVA